MVVVLLIGVACAIYSLFSEVKWLFTIGAVAAFGIYFAASGANYWVVLLFLLGVLLQVLEVYIPNVGVIGLLGFGLSFAALCLQLGSLFDTLIVTLYCLLVGGIMLFVLSKQGKSLTLSSSFVLDTTLSKEKGFSAHSDVSELVNVVGVARTDLRPVGRAALNGKVYDVISVDDVITAHHTIVVERVEGSSIYVKKGVDVS